MGIYAPAGVSISSYRDVSIQAEQESYGAVTIKSNGTVNISGEYGRVSSNDGKRGVNISNLSDPTEDYDAVTKKYVDNAISNTATVWKRDSDTKTVSLANYGDSVDLCGLPIKYDSNQGIVLGGYNKFNTPWYFQSDNEINIGSHYGDVYLYSGVGKVKVYGQTTSISNVVDPTNERDAVPKKYVDEIVAKLTAAIEALGGTVS